MRKILTIDVGGTFTKFAVARGEKNFELGGKDKIPTEKKNHERFLNSLAKIFNAHNDAEGIALSMPGLIDTERGICISSGALNFSNGHCLADELEKICAVPVTIENDANCAALAEVRSGSLVDVNDAFVLVFGTSIGGAFIHDRKIYRGVHFCAGEIAPTLQNIGEVPDEKNSYHYALSVVLFQERCAKILNKAPEEVTGEMIFDLIDAGDKKMRDVLNKFTYGVAVKIFNLQMLFDPERFALGGGISVQKIFIDAIQKKLDEISKEMLDYLPCPEIVACKHHNDANLLGALYRYLEK